MHTDKLKEIAESIDKIEQIYFDAARKALEDTSLKILKKEIQAENPSFEKIGELTIILHNEFVYIARCNNKLNKELIPLIHQLIRTYYKK